MKSFKTRIAAGATILGLGGLTGLALSAGHQKASQPVATKPLVRTKVIRRTIHVVKHVKPKHPVAAPPVAGGATYSGTAGGASVATGASSVGSAPSSSYSAPVTTSTSGASSPGSAPAAPVVTHTSGSGSGGSSHSPVVTHTSGGGGGGGGAPVVTHASGGGGGGEGDGGEHGD